MAGKPSRLGRLLKYGGLGLIALCSAGLAYYAIRTVQARASFTPRWDKAERDEAETLLGTHESLGGAWSGHWASEGLGDGGELKAIIQFNPKTGRWFAQFLADHYAIFQAEEGIEIHPSKHADNTWQFDGVAELSEGRHEYAAVCDGETIRMTWSSALDHGTVTLKRQNGRATLSAEAAPESGL